MNFKIDRALNNFIETLKKRFSKSQQQHCVFGPELPLLVFISFLPSRQVSIFLFNSVTYTWSDIINRRCIQQNVDPFVLSLHNCAMVLSIL